MPLQTLNVYFVDIYKTTKACQNGDAYLPITDVDLARQSPNTLIQLILINPNRPSSSGSTIWKMTKCSNVPPGPNLNPVPPLALKMAQHIPLGGPGNGLNGGDSVILWEQDRYYPEIDPVH